VGAHAAPAAFRPLVLADGALWDPGGEGGSRDAASAGPGPRPPVAVRSSVAALPVT